MLASDQSTVPVSAASLPLPPLAATSTKQSDGTQKTQIVDGSGNVIGSTSNALDINIKSGNPTTIAVTQTTGTNLHTVVDSGTVTANAGTNLNTSLLALESGGNLASIKTDVDNLNLAIGSTTSGQKGNLALGATTTASPTYATAQSNPLSLTTAGALRTDSSATTQPVSNAGTFAVQAALAAGSAVIGHVITDTGSTTAVTGTVTVSGTVTANAGTGNLGVNLTQVAGATVSQGHGTAATAIRMELPTDGTGVVGLNAGTNSIGKISDITASVVPGTGTTNLGKAEDAASASGDTGVFVLGIRNDTVADETNANGDYTQVSTDIKGRVLTSYVPRSLKIQGQLTLTSTTAETTVLAAIASTFQDVYGCIAANTSATACEVTFRNTTAGSVVFTVYVPAGETRGFMLPSESAYTQANINTNWTAQCGTSVASIKISLLAVKNI